MNKVINVNNKEIKFEVVGDEIFTDSLTIARVFEKEHKDAIRAIENDIAFDEFLTERKIAPSNYKDSSGKANKMYLLDRDAFSYYVMGFTGEKAKQWKLNYIKAFNEMERMLREQSKPKLPQTYIEALEELVKAEKEKLKLQQTLEKEKPRIEFAKSIENSANSILIREYAKILSNEHNVNVGQNRLFKWLRDNKYLMRNNEPYQKYIDNGYFESRVNAVAITKGIREVFTTLITGKGQVALANRIVNFFKGDNNEND